MRLLGGAGKGVMTCLPCFACGLLSGAYIQLNFYQKQSIIAILLQLAGLYFMLNGQPTCCFVLFLSRCHTTPLCSACFTDFETCNTATKQCHIFCLAGDSRARWLGRLAQLQGL